MLFIDSIEQRTQLLIAHLRRSNVPNLPDRADKLVKIQAAAVVPVEMFEHMCTILSTGRVGYRA